MKECALRKITVAGVRLRYSDCLPSPATTKAPLLLLHGLLATAESLADLTRNLPRDRRIVVLDLPSAELESGPKALDVRSEALADVVRDFARALNLERAIVIGHSYGGTLALRLAVSPGSQIGGLVLLCPAHPFAGYRPNVVAFYLKRWGRFLALSIPVAPQQLILRAFNQAAGPSSPITLAQLQPYLRVLRNRDVLRRVLQMLHTWEEDMSGLRQALLSTPVSQPALLLWGDADTVVPVSSAAALEDCLANSERVTLHGRGHLLAEEAPEECGRLIRAWLERVHNGRSSTLPQAGISNFKSSDSQPRIVAPSTPSLEFGD